MIIIAISVIILQIVKIFQRVICGVLKKARGPQQIAEVVDDMVDAVIGDEPRVCHSQKFIVIKPWTSTE